MTETATPPRSSKPSLLSGWISRLDLALELGVTVETLHRWEKLRFGPPCVRAGRKIYYRREAVQDWLMQQEAPAPGRRGARR
ncbi:helix-turn-helix transcriptional regulator [Roseovarius tibetensis]|uniref:helix-turn-helix transcriptional regulator n=1 Tax=Roseovarius tibetensis TaxID=2685897 RepID=UPI003D7FDD18